jgi:hypothetical protein
MIATLGAVPATGALIRGGFQHIFGFFFHSAPFRCIHANSWHKHAQAFRTFRNNLPRIVTPQESIKKIPFIGIKVREYPAVQKQRIQNREWQKQKGAL